MFDRFTALHNAHDGGLSFKVAIGRDSLMRDLGFLFRFLQLDLVDLDTLLLVRETGIVREVICFVHVLAFGGLDEDSVLGTRERLKGSDQFRVRCDHVSVIHPVAEWSYSLCGGSLTKPGRFLDLRVLQGLALGDIIE